MENNIPTYDQLFQMLAAMQQEREALARERQQNANEIERMKITAERLTIEEQRLLLLKEQREFYIDQKIKDADLQIRQQSFLLDQRTKDADLQLRQQSFLLDQKIKEADFEYRQKDYSLDVKQREMALWFREQNLLRDTKDFDLQKKYYIMEMALREAKLEFAQMMLEKYGSLDKREIELKTRGNELMQREIVMQIQAKDAEMKNLVASIANTNKAHDLEIMEREIEFRNKHRKNISDMIRRKGFTSIDDYMGQIWGVHNTKYLPQGN